MAHNRKDRGSIPVFAIVLWSKGKVDGSQSERSRFDPRVCAKSFLLYPRWMLEDNLTNSSEQRPATMS